MQRLELAHKNDIIGPSVTRTINILLFYKKYLFVKINGNKHPVHKMKNLMNAQRVFSKYYGAHHFGASMITIKLLYITECYIYYYTE